MIAQNEIIIRTSKRNRFFGPAFFTSLGAVFLYFNYDADDFWNFGSISGLCFILFGIVLFVIGQRYAKEMKTDAYLCVGAVRDEFVRARHRRAERFYACGAPAGLRPDRSTRTLGIV